MRIENRMVSETSSNNQPYVECENCGAPIYLETETEYPSGRYQINGHDFCEDCISAVAKELFRVK